MIPHPSLNSFKVLALVCDFAVGQSFLKRGVCMAHELLAKVVQAVQRVRVVSWMLVNGHVGGDAVADSEKAVQRMPQVNLVDAMIGSLWVRIGRGKTMLLGPCVRDRYDSVR